jgi:hypothetical protein
MPNLNVEISEELLKAIRVKCAEEGLAQKDWVPEALRKAAVRNGESIRAGKARGKARTSGKAGGEVEAGVSGGESEVVPEVGRDLGGDRVEAEKVKGVGGPTRCPRCDKPRIEWGPSFIRCPACSINFPRG